MKIRNSISKEQLDSIADGFKVLKEFHTSKSGTDIITKALNECYDSTFTISVVPANLTDKMFVMSVFPEKSTVDKILQCITTQKNNFQAIVTLWEKNKVWTIEIDEAILPIATERELVAILLHELGHIACSNAIPRRIVTILQYEYANSKMQNKVLMRNSIFRSILSIPVLNSCMGDQRDGTIKEEVEADKYVKKFGYAKDLISIMHKLTINPKYPGTDIEKEMKGVTKFSMDTLDQMRQRQDILAKDNIVNLEEQVRSPFIESTLATIHSKWFLTNDQVPTLSGRDYLIQEEVKEKTIHDIMDRTDRDFFLEFGVFGRKKLEKLEMYDIDYIVTKKNMINSESDKLVLLAYVHNKIDTVQFYLDVLDDPKESKRYKIPHSRQYLESYMKALLNLRTEILKVKIKYREPDLLVGYTPNGYSTTTGGYPAGYEG